MIRRTTWIMLLVFLVLLGAAYLIQQRTGSSERETATPTPQTALLSIPVDSVNVLTVSDAQGKVVSIKRSSESGWELVEPGGLVLDASAASSGVAQLSTLTALTTLETMPGLDVVGLAVPQFTIEVTSDGGQNQVILVGSVTATGSGYYAQVDSGPVYVVSKISLENILKLVTDPSVIATPTSEVTATEASSGGTATPLTATPTP